MTELSLINGIKNPVIKSKIVEQKKTVLWSTGNLLLPSVLIIQAPPLN
jgi:hypothetical protein